jgi:very-short-patch-repair endonuclease
MTVIDNEFDDKNYVREFPFYKFSLDFVWKDTKKVIEIDGEQHYRDEKQILRDKQKNEFLKNDGWKLLRLDWRWVFHNSKEAIKQAKEFIDYDD